MKNIANVPRRTVILAAVALALAIVFLLQTLVSPERNTIELPAISGEISAIEIGSGDDSFRIERVDDVWLIDEAGYPGDDEAIEELIAAIQAIDSVDVISNRGGDERFGLSETDQRTTLVVSSGENAARAFEIGAAAAAGDAFYGRVQDEAAVVLLPGTLDGLLSTDPTIFREKEIARFAEEEIAAVTLEALGFATIELRRVEPEAVGDEAELSEVERLERNWQVLVDGVAVDESAESESIIGGFSRQSFFREIAPFEAQGFIEGTPEGSPIARLLVERLDGPSDEFAVYTPLEDFSYPVASTTSEYVVTIPDFRLRRLLLGQNEIVDQFTAE